MRSPSDFVDLLARPDRAHVAPEAWEALADDLDRPELAPVRALLPTRLDEAPLDALVPLARAYQRLPDPVPPGLVPDDVPLEAVAAWDAVAVARDPQAAVRAPWTEVVQHLRWPLLDDHLPAVLDRVIAAHPGAAARAIDDAVRSGAVVPAAGVRWLTRLAERWPDLPDVAWLAGRPWTRAEDMDFDRVAHDPNARVDGLAGRRDGAALTELALDDQQPAYLRARALRCLPAEGVDGALLWRLHAESLLAGALLAALARAPHTLAVDDGVLRWLVSTVGLANPRLAPRRLIAVIACC